MIFLIIAILFFQNLSCAQQNSKDPLYIDPIEKNVSLIIRSDQTNIEDIQTLIPQSFFLNNITFSCDSTLSEEEFYYLTELQTGIFVETDKIIRAVRYLFKKQIYRVIELKISILPTGILIHFDLKTNWTFSKLRVHGILRGKEEYKQIYSLEFGELFDEVKHEYALGQVKEFLKNQGYHDAQVTDHCIYNHETKTVSIDLHITRGNCYIISTVNVKCKDADAQDLLLQLERVLQKKYFKQLLYQWYTKETIDSIIGQANLYIAHQGILASEIELQEEIDHNTKQVALTMHVNFAHKNILRFSGNNFFSQNVLLDQIMQFGKSVWLLPAKTLAEDIVFLYKQHGFWDVQIEIQETPGAIAETLFIIKEGARAKIEEIIIHAPNLERKQFVLRKYFKKIIHNTVDHEIIKTGLQELCSYYIAKGYLQAQIVNHSFEQIAPNKYRLIISFDPGTMANIDQVKIPDFEYLLMQRPFKQINKSKKPTQLTLDIISEQRNLLLDYFRQKGYFYVQVNPNVVKEDRYTVLYWNVVPGEKIIFGKTVIAGSTKFPLSRVLNTIAYQQGDLWNHEAIKQSLLAFKEMQVFESVQLYPDSFDKESERTVIVRLLQDDPYEVRLRGGLAFENIAKYQRFGGITYKVGGTFMTKNPCNRGDIMRLDTDFTRNHREIVAQYLFPFNTQNPVTGKLQAYHILFDHPGFIGSKKNIYRVKQNGVLWNVAQKLPYTDIGCNIGLEWQQTEIKDTNRAQELARVINFDVNSLNLQVPYLFFEPTLFIDFLDNKLNPHKGAYTLLSAKGMAPLQLSKTDSHFLKLYIEQAIFLPIANMTVALRTRIGHIFHHTFSGINPIERFYLGGSHSVRGYETDVVPPVGIFIDDEDKELLVPRGGKSMANANIELRFSLLETMGCVLFHDIGLLSESAFMEEDKLIAHATGFGIRFYTPLGPLRFDIGWKWKRLHEQEGLFAWYLSFGHSF